MPQPKKGPRLGSGPKHQKLMLSNLALSLFEHERLTTTEAKAKALRPFAERLITKAKKDDVHQRRQVLSVIEDRGVVHKLFADLGPRFAERNGGYTRILKLGPRAGDGAPMALIELVEGAAPRAPEASAEEEAQRRRLRRPTRARKDGPTPEAAAEEDSPDDEIPEGAAEDADGEPTGAPGDADSETAQDSPEGSGSEAEPEASDEAEPEDETRS